MTMPASTAAPTMLAPAMPTMPAVLIPDEDVELVVEDEAVPVEDATVDDLLLTVLVTRDVV